MTLSLRRGGIKTDHGQEADAGHPGFLCSSLQAVTSTFSSCVEHLCGNAGSTQVTQAAALGPNGLTIGPNKVDTETSQAERQAQGNLGIQNLRIGKDGLIINDGSR